jgi:hypothetical protein
MAIKEHKHGTDDKFNIDPVPDTSTTTIRNKHLHYLYLHDSALDFVLKYAHSFIPYHIFERDQLYN